MKRWMALLMMAAVNLAAWALPTVDQVQAEVAKGNYAAAEVMMRDVIAERPDSARAHYVLAQVLAHNGRLDDARTAAQRARQLDPAISFTSRQGFEDFERALAQGARPGAAAATGKLGDRTSVPPPDLAAPPPKPALPGWAWGVGGAVVAVLLWRLLRPLARLRQQEGADGGWAPPAEEAVGLLAAKYFHFAHLVTQANPELGYFSPQVIATFPEVAREFFSFFDLLWIFFALTAAWRVPAASRVELGS